MYFSEGTLNLDFILNKYTLILLPVFALYGIVSMGLDIVAILDISIKIGQ